MASSDKDIKQEPSTSSVKNEQKIEELAESDDDSDLELDEKAKHEILNKKVSEDYNHELELDLDSKQKQRKRSSRTSKMPAYLMGLMGEANLRYARGEYETCEKMCFEIIRQAPYVFEPYVTLSQLYESDNLDKCIQYLTIAAHLKPYDVDQWCRLGQMNSHMDNKRKAVTCFTNALKYSQNDYEIQKRRIQILQELGDFNAVLRCQVRLLNTLDPETKSEELLTLSKQLAHKYHDAKEYGKAIEVLNVAFNKIPSNITPDYVNILLELLLLNENYSECLDIFLQFCNIEIEVFIGENNEIKVLSYNMPQNIQIDLKIKFITCLVKMKSFDLIPMLLDPLLIEEDVELVGDLFLDVAEALMSVSRPEDALKLLVPLIKSKNFYLAAVWLKYAECLEACQMYEQAIDSYMNVVRMAPQHLEARHTLGNLLVKCEKYKEALHILNQDVSTGDLDVELLIKQINLFRKLDMFDNYCKSMDLLFSRHCIMAKRYEEIQFMIMLDRCNERMMKIRKIRKLRSEDDCVSYNCLNEPTVEAELEVVRDCFRYCFEKRRFDQLQKYSFQSLLVNKFKNQFDELHFFCFYTALYNDDAHHAYRVVRELVFRYPSSVLLWNLLNMCPRKVEKAPKFVLRFIDNIDNDILKIFEANNSMFSGNFKMAAMQLMPFFKANRSPSPFICLYMAVILAQMSRQRTSKMRVKLTQTVYTLFLTYANKRGKEARHETFYNLGRMYQYFGLSHLAIYYYKKVLNYSDPLIDEHPDVLDLKRETAYNLFILYKECENYVLAKQILIKHLTI